MPWRQDVNITWPLDLDLDLDLGMLIGFKLRSSREDRQEEDGGYHVGVGQYVHAAPKMSPTNGHNDFEF